MSAPTKSFLDASQCTQGAFDDATGSFRTTVVNIVEDPNTGATEVSIDAADDSIKIGDGNGHYIAVNPNGSINVEGNLSTTISGTVTTSEQGLNAFQTSQYTIGTSAVQLTPTPLSNRSSVSLAIIADPNVAIYIGNSNSVTTSNGYPLYDGNTIELDLTPSGTIWAISTTTGQTVAALEIA